jgi:hypothetical protein
MKELEEQYVCVCRWVHMGVRMRACMYACVCVCVKFCCKLGKNFTQKFRLLNSLTPELNASCSGCLTEFFSGVSKFQFLEKNHISKTIPSNLMK